MKLVVTKTICQFALEFQRVNLESDVLPEYTSLHMRAYLDFCFNKEKRAIQGDYASLQSQKILHLDFKENDNAGNKMKELQ